MVHSCSFGGEKPWVVEVVEPAVSLGSTRGSKHRLVSEAAFAPFDTFDINLVISCQVDLDLLRVFLGLEPDEVSELAG